MVPLTEIETAGTTSWLEMFLTFPERTTVWDHRFEEKNKAATNTVKKRKLSLISVSLELGAIPVFHNIIRLFVQATKFVSRN